MDECALPNEAVGDHIGLKHLWQLQEQAFSYNCQQSRPLQDALGLLDRSVRLNLSILTAMRFGAAKQTVIRVLAADALSRIIVAARIGIWGALPECLSVLRGATESCAQLTLTVSQNLYETALQEINGKKLVRLKFEAVCKDLGELGTAFRRRHSKMSDLAAHATASSLRQAEYRKDGESYDRLGAAESPRNAEIATSECLEYLALVAVATLDAYSKDAIEEVWLATLSELNLSHGALKNQISAT